MQEPKREIILPPEKLERFDALYERGEALGQAAGWGTLVDELRELRRAVEAGAVLKVEGEPPIHDWQTFYSWAHGRYYKLEEGCDKWIGHDEP